MRNAYTSVLRNVPFLFALGISNVALAQWVQDPPGKPFNFLEAGALDSNSGPIHHNSSQSAIVIEGFYGYTRYDYVSGAAEASPPAWSLPFAALYNLSDVVQREYAKTLPAQKSGRVFDKLLTTEGAETWSNGSNAYQRTKITWTTAKIEYLKTWDFGTEEPGGQ